jgi:hypothetical protein
MKPETKFSATFAQWSVGLGVVISTTLWAHGQFRDIKDGQQRIEAFIKSEAVTQNQAVRYAAEFRWENRALGITVPDVSKFRDPQ